MRFFVVGVVQNMGGLGACVLGSFKSACFSFVGSSTMVGAGKCILGSSPNALFTFVGSSRRWGIGGLENALWEGLTMHGGADHSNSEGLVTSKCNLFGRA